MAEVAEQPIVGQAGQAALGLKLPTGYDPTLGTRRAEAAGAELESKQAAINEKISAEQQKREAAIKPIQEGLVTKGQDLSATLEKGAVHQDLPQIPKFTPTDVQENAGWLVALASFAGLVSRQPLTASLNAISGMVEGVRKGDEARFQHSYKEYEANIKTVIEKNRQYEKEFDRIVKSKELSMSQQLEQIRLLNLQFDRSVAQVAAQNGDIANVYKLKAEMMKATEATQANLLRIKSMAEARADANATRIQIAESANQTRRDIAEAANAQKKSQTEARAWVTFQKPDGTVVGTNLVTGEKKEMKGTEGLVKPKAGGGVGGAGKTMNALQSTLYEDIATGYQRMDMLKEIFKQTGELPGGSPALQMQIHNDGLISAVKQWGVNKTMPAEFQQTDALLLGIAFDVASARSGGRGQLSDSKIREVTRQMPLGSDEESTRALKYTLIDQQLSVANQTLPDQFQYDPTKKGPKGGGHGGAAATVADAPPPPKEQRIAGETKWRGHTWDGAGWTE